MRSPVGGDLGLHKNKAHISNLGSISPPRNSVRDVAPTGMNYFLIFLLPLF